MTTPTYPAKYKVTFAPPTDTDPPSAPIWTVDDFIGTQPPYLNIHQLPDPYDYGAVGDGATDDTVAYQAWLDAIAGGAGYGARGTFAVSSTVFISGSTTIYGAGSDAHFLTKMAGFPASQSLLKNKTFAPAPAPAIDASIRVYGICVQGIAGDLTSVELVSMVGVFGYTFRDCLFQHNRRFLIATSNSIGCVVDCCEFNDWGVLASTGEGGEALWFAATTQDVSITNCYFHNGEWGAVLINGGRNVIAGNRILVVKEGAITGSPTGATITGNIISGVKIKTAHGTGIILSEAQFLAITGNQIYICDESSIFLVDPTIATVTGNVCNLAGQNQANFPQSAAIQIDAVTAAGVVDTVISDNVCSDASGNCAYGIRLSNFGFPTAPIYAAFQCCNNNLSSTGWRIAPLLIDSNVAGSTTVDVAPNTEFICRGNLGTRDEDRTAVVWTIPSGSSGSMQIGGVGFKPRAIDFRATINSTALQASSVGSAMWHAQWDPATQSVLVGQDNFTADALSWSGDGTTVYSGGTNSLFPIVLMAADGVTPICRASVTGITDDGFVIAFNEATTMDVSVTAICHP